jgi:predicted  nucleic acid-binding Zn-ribbon protein
LLDSLRRLLRLQELDSAIAVLDGGLGELPGRREAMARGIVEAKESVAAAAELLESEERDERRLEGDMRQQEALGERLNAQSGQVQSTQAYEALQHEMQHASEASSRCETEALELMEAIDEARTRLAQAKEHLVELEKSEPGQQEELASKEAEFSAQRAEQLEARRSVCEGIDPKSLSSYERIAGSRQPIVVALTEKFCPACRIAVPPQEIMEITRGDAVHVCSSCQRLLISSRALDEAD